MHSRSRPARVHSAHLPRSAGSKIGLAVAAALATIAAPRARALDAAAAADASGGGALQEVVVTARKREENLQDVPVSIDVFTKKDMQNLGIAGFDDYAQKVPSISFISTGPGTQLFVMRGVSDGSNPNYANTSSTGFFIDDMSLSWEGAQPDLHLYDIERIEVLNGPQGTTFGAGSMSGAIRYITNKPDVNAFSAGVDFDGGKIQSAQQNWTYEGFVNIPLDATGVLGLRASAFSDSHGGFINNQLTTRTWVNGSVSNNAEWARQDYNREHVEGGRVALKAVFSEGWSALLTLRVPAPAHLRGVGRGPDPGRRARCRASVRSSTTFESKMTEFHWMAMSASATWCSRAPTGRCRGDSGTSIRSTSRTSTPAPRPTPPAGFPGTQEGFTCLDDPYFGTQYAGCKPPLQFYSYNISPERWSDELRLASKPGGRFHWLGGPVLGEDHRQELQQHLLHAEPAVPGRGVPELPQLLRPHPADACRRVSGMRTPSAPTTCRPTSSRTSASTSPTSSTSKRAPCISIPTPSTTRRSSSSPTPLRSRAPPSATRTSGTASSA